MPRRLKFYWTYVPQPGDARRPEKDVFDIADLALAQKYVDTKQAYDYNDEDVLPPGWVTPDFTRGGGGGGTTDLVAQATANAAQALIKEIYKSPGDTVAGDNGTGDGGNEFFVKMKSGRPMNWKNPSTGNLTIPATPTIAAMKAAGFVQITGALDPNAIIQTWQSARTAWSATAQVDFTVAEPALTAANLGKIYWSTKTGTGSTTTSATFDNGDLYEMFDPGTGVLAWSEYKPTEGWTVTYQGKTYLYTAGAWTLQPTDKHQHPFLCDVTPIGAATVIYRVVPGSQDLWQNAKANPDTTIPFTDPAWSTNWKKAIQPSNQNWVYVADNATLAVNTLSAIAPANAVVVHLTAPAVVAGGYFAVANLGAGIVDVGGTQLTGNGSLYYTANAAGNAWVLTSMTSPSTAIKTLQDTWLSAANADYTTQGMASFKQIKNAIFEEYRYLNSGSWDANDAPKALNQYISGSSGVTTTNFPNGLAAPAAFISEFYGTTAGGVQRLTIFGLPTNSRGVWSRIYQGGSNWTAWQLESPYYFDFTPSPANLGDTYTITSGNIAINDGDILLLRESGIKSAARATPVTTWDKVGTIDLSASAKAAGWTIEGTQPATGNAVIDLFTDNFAKKWIIRLPSAPAAAQEFTQNAVVTATNTIANLLHTPTSAVFWEINGIAVDSGITNTGQTVAYDPAIVGYNVETIDTVKATYTY